MELWQAMGDAYPVMEANPMAGELVYGAHLFAERKDQCKEQFVELLESRDTDPLMESAGQLFEAAHAATGAQLERLGTALGGGGFGLVGLTTPYSQLLGSVALARLIKRTDPGVRICLGGAGVSHVGASLLERFPEVDAVVEGDGETALVELVEMVERGQDEDFPRRFGNDRWEDPEQLPDPDFGEYHEIAEELEVLWDLPLEGSRGCWWNRAFRTGDANHACKFCSLNHGPYREKSAHRIATEMVALADRYQNVRFRFTDNVLRARGAAEMAQQIAAQQRNFLFFIEARASAGPEELLALWEAGCMEMQIGVEGLSETYLRRLNKGTTPIRNLQAMRACYELGISSRSNLLLGFPGASAAEVEETVQVIRGYAVAYHPANTSQFALELGSAAQLAPEAHGVARIRDEGFMARALPADLGFELPWKEYEPLDPPADWAPVRQACEDWRELHRRLEHDQREPRILAKPLYYLDGKSFLEIVDRRDGFRMITLEPLWRQVYLYCMRIRSLPQLLRRFHGRCPEETLTHEILPALVQERLIYRQRDRLLSLAVACRPDLAAARIREGN